MRRGVEITIVFRYFTSSEDAQKRSPFIDDTFELNNLRIISCPDLHAKIYVNEVRAILTSRNLYERKEGSSIEVGVRYNKVSDSKMYNDLLMLAREISQFEMCDTVVDNTKAGRKRIIPRYPKEGFCIRCRDCIPFNPERPYCLQCYYDWKYGEDEDERIPERFCHRCGMRKPNICKKDSQDRECSCKD